jgi:hypothetical protein
MMVIISSVSLFHAFLCKMAIYFYNFMKIYFLISKLFSILHFTNSEKYEGYFLKVRFIFKYLLKISCFCLKMHVYIYKRKTWKSEIIKKTGVLKTTRQK